jgi:hypothetical protein
MGHEDELQAIQTVKLSITKQVTINDRRLQAAKISNKKSQNKHIDER